MEVESYVNVDGLHIKSQSSLKTLGFVFSDNKGMHEHVKKITKTFYMRLWRLRHLKRNGVGEEDLAKMYGTMLRSVIEYAAVLYHHQLTRDQSDQIERMQRTALKIIFGSDTHYSVALEKSSLHRLSDRRDELFKKLTVKTFNNPRYNTVNGSRPPPRLNRQNEKKPSVQHGEAH